VKNIRTYVVRLTVLFLLAVVGWSIHVYFFKLPDIPDPTDHRAQRNLPVTGLTLQDGTRLAVEVARSSKEKERGLMYRDNIPPLTGMLFVHEKEDYHSIWMRNTKVDLDLVFLNSEQKILLIYSNVSHSEPGDENPETRVGMGRYVLELAAGEARRLGLRKGQILNFTLPGQYRR
jgi:uncharacterized protein